MKKVIINMYIRTASPKVNQDSIPAINARIALEQSTIQVQAESIVALTLAEAKAALWREVAHHNSQDKISVEVKIESRQLDYCKRITVYAENGDIESLDDKMFKTTSSLAKNIRLVLFEDILSHENLQYIH